MDLAFGELDELWIHHINHPEEWTLDPDWPERKEWVDLSHERIDPYDPKNSFDSGLFVCDSFGDWLNLDDDFDEQISEEEIKELSRRLCRRGCTYG